MSDGSRRLRTYLLSPLLSPVSWFSEARGERGRGPGIRWITIGCVGLLALIPGTVSNLHMHMLTARHGQPGWAAALTPLSVDGLIVAASTTLLADSRSGRQSGTH